MVLVLKALSLSVYNDKLAEQSDSSAKMCQGGRARTGRSISDI